MKRFESFVLALVVAVSAANCASGPRHFATVSVVTAHSTLAAIQDVEMALVCGRPTAPQAPQCVPLERHRQISSMLATAFDLDARAARIVRALPAGSGLPADVSTLTAQVSGLINQVLLLLPQSKQKTTLVKQLEAK